MEVPLLDLKRQYKSIKEEIDSAIQRVVDSQYFILGDEVESFEKEIADYCGTKHAIGVASGTDALKLSLEAAGVGEGKNDKVITTPFTYFATAGSIVNAGAEPVFVDIKPDTFNIDPEGVRKLLEGKKDAPQATSHKPQAYKAIIPVHLYGQMADMDPIMELAERFDLAVIEDAAQAIGATYQSSLSSQELSNSNHSPQTTDSSQDSSSPLTTNHSPPTEKKAGSMGDLGCFSFFPTKNLGGYGDGGMVVTDDGELAEKVRMLRVHGSKKKYYNEMVGYNSRLDAIQAAVLSAKLPYLNDWSKVRAENAAKYDENLVSVPGIKTPELADNRSHIYHQYTVRVKEQRRGRLQSFLDKQNIGNKIYYPLSLHQQGCFDNLSYSEGDFLNSEQASQEVLSLPIFSELRSEEILFVCSKIEEFMQR